jgi:hypothetical protein
MNRYPEEFYWLAIFVVLFAFLLVGAWIAESQPDRRWIRRLRAITSGRCRQASETPASEQWAHKIDEAATLIEQRGWNYPQEKLTEK